MFVEGRLRAVELEGTCDGCSDVPPGSDTGENPLLATKTSSAGLGSRFIRIPLQMFGMGLIDAIQDREILRRHAESAAYRAQFGVEGVPNRSAKDGAITRFGWKAQILERPTHRAHWRARRNNLRLLSQFVPAQ